jgi:hypothetical protein
MKRNKKWLNGPDNWKFHRRVGNAVRNPRRREEVPGIVKIVNFTVRGILFAVQRIVKFTF